MPPDLDIYGLTKHRDALTIDRFLDAYVDRAKSWDRGDEALMMEPLLLTYPGEEDESAEPDTFEWEPALTLSHILERGLASPRRAFTVYLVPKRADLTRVLLRFTTDDQLVLGIALDDKGADPKNERRARELLSPAGGSVCLPYGTHSGRTVSTPQRNGLFCSRKQTAHHLF